MVLVRSGYCSCGKEEKFCCCGYTSGSQSNPSSTPPPNSQKNSFHFPLYGLKRPVPIGMVIPRGKVQNWGISKERVFLVWKSDIGAVATIVHFDTRNQIEEYLSLNQSFHHLLLVLRSTAFALIKASSVLLMKEADNFLFSTRNQFNGKVSKIKKGAINDEVQVDLPDGTAITSMITEASVENLGLAVGSPVTFIFKAMNVILAVPAK